MQLQYTGGTGVATPLMNVQWPTTFLPGNLLAFWVSTSRVFPKNRHLQGGRTATQFPLPFFSLHSPKIKGTGVLEKSAFSAFWASLRKAQYAVDKNT